MWPQLRPSLPKKKSPVCGSHLQRRQQQIRERLEGRDDAAGSLGVGARGGRGSSVTGCVVRGSRGIRNVAKAKDIRHSCARVHGPRAVFNA